MDERIIHFIHSKHILSLAVTDGSGVYSANCFYAFDEANLELIFASCKDSKHIKLALINPNLALNIFTDTHTIGLIKGVQIKALFKEASLEQIQIYYKRFPFAKFHSGSIFSLKIQWLKYTDNKLLLAKKIEFQL